MKQRSEIFPLFQEPALDGGYTDIEFREDKNASRIRRKTDARPLTPAKPTTSKTNEGGDRLSKSAQGLREAMSGFLNRVIVDAGNRDRKHRDGADDAALAATTELFRDISEAITSEVALLDSDGAVAMVNSAWLANLASNSFPDAGDWVGLSLWELLLALDPDAAGNQLLERQVERLQSGAAPRLRHRYTSPAHARHRLSELRITAMRIGGPVHFVVVREDLGPESRSAQDQYLFAAEALFAEEEARQRIAMELHDSTSQHLVVLSLGIARLRRITTRYPAGDVLANMSLSVNEMMKEIRVLSHLLKPPELEHQGLSAAVGGYLKGFSARTGITCEFHADEAVDAAAPAVRHAAFRIVQEALSNVYRHANASTVSVRLESQDDVLKVLVGDDGKGIHAVESDAFMAGVGISGMRTRVAQLGGRFDISSPGRGVLISAELPARAPQAH